MSADLSISSQQMTYFKKVYKGYSYLWKEASEIFWHQFVYDPIQDTFLKKGFESIIQYGQPAQAINFHVDTGIHKLIHDFAGTKLAHGLEGFLFELGVHAGIKVLATAVFPLIHPLNLMDNISNNIKENFIANPIKLMGIHPLEIVNTMKVIPDQIVGPNNLISNTIDSLTLHKDHFHDRANDEEYEQYMKYFNMWLESVDAFVHMFDDLSVLYNNRHLPHMTTKAYFWFLAKLQMYYNTESAGTVHDYKVYSLRIEKTHENENTYMYVKNYNTWSNLAYDNFWHASNKVFTWIVFPFLLNKIRSADPQQNQNNAEGAIVQYGKNTLLSTFLKVTFNEVYHTFTKVSNSPKNTKVVTNLLDRNTPSGLAKLFHSTSDDDSPTPTKELTTSLRFPHIDQEGFGRTNTKTSTIMSERTSSQSLLEEYDPQFSTKDSEATSTDDQTITCGNDISKLSKWIKPFVPAQFHSHDPRYCTTPNHKRTKTINSDADDTLTTQNTFNSQSSLSLNYKSEEDLDFSNEQKLLGSTASLSDLDE